MRAGIDCAGLVGRPHRPAFHGPAGEARPLRAVHQVPAGATPEAGWRSRWPKRSARPHAVLARWPGSKARRGRVAPPAPADRKRPSRRWCRQRDLYPRSRMSATTYKEVVMSSVAGCGTGCESAVVGIDGSPDFWCGRYGAARPAQYLQYLFYEMRHRPPIIGRQSQFIWSIIG